jgi:hypothetical protein
VSLLTLGLWFATSIHNLALHCRPQTSPTFFDVEKYPMRSRRDLLKWLCVGSFGLSLFAATASAQDKPLVPDKNLETALKAELKKKAEEPLKEEDLKNVFFLEAKKKEIADLTGLEKCPNLALINLSGNKLTNLAPLAGLSNLQSLDLSKNQIADIAPLAKLEKLQYLQLEDNQIEKADAVAGLVKLQALYLSKNKITSVEPLAKLEKLASLYLGNNAIEDISHLKALKWVNNLDLRGNKVKDLSPLAGFTELRFTFLAGNPIADFAPLIAMAKADTEGQQRFAPYWKLYLDENALSDAAKKQLEELKKFGVRINPK